MGQSFFAFVRNCAYVSIRYADSPYSKFCSLWQELWTGIMSCEDIKFEQLQKAKWSEMQIVKLKMWGERSLKLKWVAKSTRPTTQTCVYQHLHVLEHLQTNFFQTSYDKTPLSSIVCCQFLWLWPLLKVTIGAIQGHRRQKLVHAFSNNFRNMVMTCLLKLKLLLFVLLLVVFCLGFFFFGGGGFGVCAWIIFKEVNST